MKNSNSQKKTMKQHSKNQQQQPNNKNDATPTNSTINSEFVTTKQSSLCILIPNHHHENKNNKNNRDDGEVGDESNFSLFDHIQHIRQENDKSFNRWPPHMNLMYPFVHKKFFFKAKQLIEQVIEREHVQSFTIDLPAHEVYCREFSKFVLASPINEKQLETLQEIYGMMKKIFPQCNATGSGGILEEGEGKNVEERFHPHLTLGQLSNSNLANVKKRRNDTNGKSETSQPNEFEKIRDEWKGGRFGVCELVFMWRESLEEPFHVTERIPLLL